MGRPAKTRAWERDTLVPIFSTTKMMVTLCVLMLVDQGRIDLDAPIATYWPDFAAGGKDRVTVRDFFSHQAGAPGFTPGVPVSLFLDWEASAARVAAEPHWFGGERRVIYHGGTYGMIGGELIRRVDGRLPAQFFREEVAAPAGLDFHFGDAQISDPSRIAELRRPPPASPPPAPPEGLLGRLAGSYLPVEGLRTVMTMNPSNNGVANARAIARGCAILAGGGILDGRRYLSSAMVDEAYREQAYGECPYLGGRDHRFADASAASSKFAPGAPHSGEPAAAIREFLGTARSRGAGRGSATAARSLAPPRSSPWAVNSTAFATCRERWSRRPAGGRPMRNARIWDG